MSGCSASKGFDRIRWKIQRRAWSNFGWKPPWLRLTCRAHFQLQLRSRLTSDLKQGSRTQEWSSRLARLRLRPWMMSAHEPTVGTGGCEVNELTATSRLNRDPVASEKHTLLKTSSAVLLRCARAHDSHYRTVIPRCERVEVCRSSPNNCTGLCVASRTAFSGLMESTQTVVSSQIRLRMSLGNWRKATASTCSKCYSVDAFRYPKGIRLLECSRRFARLSFWQ